MTTIGRPLGQGLGGGQAARLAHEQVGGRHELVHLGGEAQELERDARGLWKFADHPRQPRAQLLVAAADATTWAGWAGPRAPG